MSNLVDQPLPKRVDQPQVVPDDYPFVPLPTDPIVVIIPDSPAGLCNPPVTIPGEIPASIAPPANDPAPVAPPLTPVLEREGILESGYFWFALWVARLLCYAGIVWIISVNVIYPVYGFVAWLAGSVAAGGGSVLVTALMIAGVWRLVNQPGTAKPKAAPAPVPVSVLARSPKTPKLSRQKHTTPKASRQKKATTSPARDPLTTSWLAKMRDPETGQSISAWRDGDDRCAVGHLMENHNPKGWRGGGNGKKHLSWRAMNKKYGRSLISKVISMNDRGKPLPEIADYVEQRVR
jgi:cell division septation protein DedD